jgi:hypothetical protein
VQAGNNVRLLSAHCLSILHYLFSKIKKGLAVASHFIDPIPAGVYPREGGGGNDKEKGATE